jgi:hypothetical protein
MSVGWGGLGWVRAYLLRWMSSQCKLHRVVGSVLSVAGFCFVVSAG